VIVVVMEPGMKESQKWEGVFGAEIGGELYLDMTGGIDQRNCEELYHRTMTIVPPKDKDTKNNSGSAIVAPPVPPPPVVSSSSSSAGTKPGAEITLDYVGAWEEIRPENYQNTVMADKLNSFNDFLKELGIDSFIDFDGLEKELLEDIAKFLKPAKKKNFRKALKLDC
jgi:hypothetical protein